ALDPQHRHLTLFLDLADPKHSRFLPERPRAPDTTAVPGAESGLGMDIRPLFARTCASSWAPAQGPTSLRGRSGRGHEASWELRSFVASADAELLHPAPERAGLEAEAPRGAVGPFDHPVGGAERLDDVFALDRLQGLVRDRRSGDRFHD